MKLSWLNGNMVCEPESDAERSVLMALWSNCKRVEYRKTEQSGGSTGGDWHDGEEWKRGDGP